MVYQEQPTASLLMCDRKHLPGQDIHCTSSSTFVNSQLPVTAKVIPKGSRLPHTGTQPLCQPRAPTGRVAQQWHPLSPDGSGSSALVFQRTVPPGWSTQALRRDCPGGVPWGGALGGCSLSPIAAHPQPVILAGPVQLGTFYDEQGLLACPRASGGAGAVPSRRAPFPRLRLFLNCELPPLVTARYRHQPAPPARSAPARPC